MFRQDLFRSGRWGAVVTPSFAVTSYGAQDTSETTMAVEWWLTEGGSGQIEYGPTVSYGSTTTLESGLLEYHRQSISGLDAGETVYYNIISVNAASATATQASSYPRPGAVPETTAGPRPAPAFPTGENVVHISGSIVDDGSVDVTSQLQAFIDTANAGDILVFTQSDPEGFEHGDSPISTYRITSRLNLQVPNGVTLWGYGTRIIQYRAQADATASILGLDRQDIDRLTIAGFDIHGANAAYSRTTNIYTGGVSGEAAMGIHLRRRHTNLIIEDCWVHHNRGDGIYQAVWGEWNWVGIQYPTVRYCRVEDNRRQGITNNCGLDWHIHHNVIGNQGGYSIDAEDNKGAQEDLGIPNPSLSAVIEDNLFEQTTWAPASAGGPFGAAVHISCTWGWNQLDPPPNFDQLGPFVIRNNTCTGVGIAGLTYTRPQFLLTNPTRTAANVGSWGDYDPIDGVTVTGNVFDLPAAEQSTNTYAAALRKVTGAVVTGNTFQGCLVDVPTSGYGANTGVTVSGNT